MTHRERSEEERIFCQMKREVDRRLVIKEMCGQGERAVYICGMPCSHGSPLGSKTDTGKSQISINGWHPQGINDTSVSDPNPDWILIKLGQRIRTGYGSTLVKIGPPKRKNIQKFHIWRVWTSFIGLKKTDTYDGVGSKEFSNYKVFFLFCHCKSWSGSGLDPYSATGWIRLRIQQDIWIWIRINRIRIRNTADNTSCPQSKKKHDAARQGDSQDYLYLIVMPCG